MEYLDSDPDTNIEKILNWLIKIDKEDKYIGFQAKVVRKHLSDPNNNWNKLIKSLWTDIDDGVRKKLFVNFLLNATFLGGKRQQKMREKYDCNIPWAILFDPTTSCNLQRLLGADYPKSKYGLLPDKIITQGKPEFILPLLREPLVRRRHY